MDHPKIIGFIARSKRRTEVLKLLSYGEKSQTEIMKITKMYKAHTSRTLKELFENKLIICKNPEDRTFRFYNLTSLGKTILREVERLFSLK